MSAERVKLTKAAIRRNRLHEDACDPMAAINWILDHGPSGEVRTFLADWRCGDFGEWPDYVEWVRKNPPVRAIAAGDRS